MEVRVWDGCSGRWALRFLVVDFDLDGLIRYFGLGTNFGT